MTIKVNILFESTTPVTGWSEVYYHSGSDIVATQTDVLALVSARKAMLPADCAIMAERAYIIGQKRYGITNVENPPQSGTWTTGERSTEPWSALLMQLGSNFQVQVAKYLHGIPQSQIVEGQYTPTDLFTTALTAYTTVLTTKFKIWAKNPATGGDKQEWAITDIDVERLVSHRVGRPFGLFVGRRLART